MKYEDRKDFPEIEGFSPDGWEVIEEEEYPDFLKSVIEQAQENIKKRGGKRDGAGRPKGTARETTSQVRLPEDVAEWIREDRVKNIEEIRSLMPRKVSLSGERAKADSIKSEFRLHDKQGRITERGNVDSKAPKKDPLKSKRGKKSL